MALYAKGIQKTDPLPKMTRQGNSANTKLSATSRNGRKKAYRGQGK
jgi:hypothetical protein